jgi:hypothetical protein
VPRCLLWFAAGALVATLGFSAVRARTGDETELTVLVSAADHEQQEGYFSLGAETTVVARPGSELYKFLTRQRGRKIHVTLSDAARPDLERLDR